uniref:Solute carrier family 25 member 29 n=1 Tax=Coturnix japonica TaxID=93934 RepID=A0A8C2SS03_COTJA
MLHKGEGAGGTHRETDPRAGSAAGAIQCIICCPMELAKTRMQLQGTGEYKQKTKNYKNSLDCLIKIYRKEGLRGINRGMVSTVIRETPSFGFYFLTYDCMTRYLGCEAEDSYVIPKLYSTTEKTKKGVWRIFWLRESAVFYFYLFSSLFKRSEL